MAYARRIYENQVQDIFDRIVVKAREEHGKTFTGRIGEVGFHVVIRKDGEIGVSVSKPDKYPSPALWGKTIRAWPGICFRPEPKPTKRQVGKRWFLVAKFKIVETINLNDLLETRVAVL